MRTKKILEKLWIIFKKNWEIFKLFQTYFWELLGNDSENIVGKALEIMPADLGNLKKFLEKF